MPVALPAQAWEEARAPEPSPAASADFAFGLPRAASTSPVSPLFSRQQRLVEKRCTVAEWLYALTGAAVPTDSDEAFRSALSDGVTLCRLLNALQPGTIPRVRAGRAAGRRAQGPRLETKRAARWSHAPGPAALRAIVLWANALPARRLLLFRCPGEGAPSRSASTLSHSPLSAQPPAPAGAGRSSRPTPWTAPLAR